MSERLELALPADPRMALAVRRWAARNDIELVPLGALPPVADGKRRYRPPRSGPRYPWTCQHGHVIAGPDAEKVVQSGGRIMRRCRQCTMAANRRTNAERRARARAERAAAS
jgi:hypothetical protein